MFIVNLTGQVPLYGQESCCWCGAACGQMIMDGYPPPNPSILYPQVDVWNAIQARNAESAAWCTDPTGLRLTLRDFNPPLAGTWNEHSDANRNTVLQAALFWMATNGYPVPTLINSGGHWITVVGYETDIDPRTGTATLDEITYNDPEPHNVGTQTTITGAAWLAGPWNGAIIYGNIWNGLYVAIIEPPEKPGRLKVVGRIVVTGKIISPKQAVAAALRHVKARGLAKRKEYAVLRSRTFTPFESPQLVFSDPRPVKERVKGPLRFPKNAPRFYAVPFGFEYERSERGGRLARISIVVNAYNGDFLSVTAFGKPVALLSEEEAVAIVLRALRESPRVRKRIRARLIFRPSEQTHVVSYPIWEITVGTKTLFVDQKGLVSAYIEPSRPGD
jgi:hypothetical protein